MFKSRGGIILLLLAAIVVYFSYPSSKDEASFTALPQADAVSPTAPGQPAGKVTRGDELVLKKKRVVIIGAAGYVGSGISDALRRSYAIQGFDRNPRATQFADVVRAHGRDVPQATVDQADVVIYLGGFTGRVRCEAHSEEEVTQENVHDVVDFALRMKPSQLLLFASTSAIGEGFGADGLFTEEDTPQVALFDAYTRSMHRREVAMRELAEDPAHRGKLPRLVAMRFGTIIGVSPSQRLEFVHVAMVRSALLEGRIHVRHPETSRSFLAIEDLSRAIDALISSPSRLQASALNLFHLVSFSGTVGQQANEIASITGVPVTFHDHAGDDVRGFALSAKRFEELFEFKFAVTPEKAILQLIGAASHVKVGREIMDHTHHGSHQCRVCGSHDVVEVLDLGDQPLANDFRATAEDAESCPRFPLRLHRCRKCHHAQLSTMVDRKALFSNYSYRSGTSRTLDEYFGWLANRVTEEVRSVHQGPGNLTILEIACNDGTQLNHFKRLGWETYGVDPAANLVVHAIRNGHKVATGLWGAVRGKRFEELPEKVDAIVAQNVLAHVPDPPSFLAACVEMMHDTTLLYLQTSQCEMFSNGQFDTVYHEHISFFSPSSFQALASQMGLRIVKYEITPIHGGSCFVTLTKSQRIPSDRSIEHAVRVDAKRGMTGDAFYVDYRARAMATRTWMTATLESAAAQGIDIVAYGAAAKGMVLMLYTLALKPRFTFRYVVDDAPLKQNTYCPGTRIPVKPTSQLGEQECGRDMMIVVFSWNFWDEIRGRINRAMASNARSCNRSFVWVLLPFPEQRLIALSLGMGGGVDAEATSVVNPFHPPRLPLLTLDAARRQVVMVTHFYNEELLLPYFINHHAPMFDRVILIDCGSTDNGVKVIERLAPSSWTVVRSKHPDNFHYQLVDDEVTEWENQFPGWWKIALTTTEFLVHPDLRGYLSRLEAAGPRATHRFRSVLVVGNDDTPLKRFSQLILQRNEYPLHYGRPQINVSLIYSSAYSRILHQLGRETTPRYYSGRHNMTNQQPHSLPSEGFIAKFFYSPWPELKTRKLQIGGRIPVEHLQKGMGNQHNATAELLEANRNRIRGAAMASLSNVFASCNASEMTAVHRTWYETVHGSVEFKHKCLPG